MLAALLSLHVLCLSFSPFPLPSSLPLPGAGAHQGCGHSGGGVQDGGGEGANRPEQAWHPSGKTGTDSGQV